MKIRWNPKFGLSDQFLTLCPLRPPWSGNNWKFKSLTRKPSNRSFSSTWCNNVIFGKKSLSPFRSRWVQEVIFEIAEAKLWIFPNFHRFSLENFCLFEFRGCLNSATLGTSEGLGWKISIHGNLEPLGCTLSLCGSHWLGLWLFV